MREVRLDETVAIEVDAIDPDFALCEVRLHGEVAGRAVLDEPLLSSEHTGHFTGRLSFTPRDHQLQPGDVMRYWLAARDNRTPQANEAASDSQTLKVVAPDPRQPKQPQEGQRDQPEKREPQDGKSVARRSAAARRRRPVGRQSLRLLARRRAVGFGGGPIRPGRRAKQGRTLRREFGRQIPESRRLRCRRPIERRNAAGKSKRTKTRHRQRLRPPGEIIRVRRNVKERSAAIQRRRRVETRRQVVARLVRRRQRRRSIRPHQEVPPAQGSASQRPRRAAKRFQRRPIQRRQGSASGQDGENGQQQAKPNQQDNARANADKQSGSSGESKDAQPDSENRPAGSPDQSGESADQKTDDTAAPDAGDRPGESGQEAGEKPADQNGKQQPPDGQPTSSQGESGAGDQPEQRQGSPETQPK